MSKKSDERAARTAALRAEQERQQRRRRNILVGAIAAGLVAVVGIGYLVLTNLDSTGDEATATPSGVDGYSVLVGDEAAPTTVTVYEDLQCPVCAAFEDATSDQVADAIEAGDVRVEYRLVSFLDQASGNEYSSRAMNAALVVLDTAGVDAFKTFHDELFADQPEEGTDGPEDDELIDLAVEAGAEESAIRQPIEDKVYEQWIENATDEMSKDGVNGTPTVDIDGERVEGSPQDAIDAVLAAIG